MTISVITEALEQLAPASLQEDYDNAGLITGEKHWECNGVLVSLDVTVAVIQEAIDKGCNLVVAHHPIVFRGLKKINGKNHVERTVIMAIKNDIAVYAIHTNLDNVEWGVNGKIADLLELQGRSILQPKSGQLNKLAVYVPLDHAEKLKCALFAAGAGNIGQYSECSFEVEGNGNYRAGNEAQPFRGEKGVRHTERELKLEVVFPTWLNNRVISAMLQNHPYEEVAYDVYSLANNNAQLGSGMIGELAVGVPERAFLTYLKHKMGLKTLRYTPLTGKEVKRVAVCGGAGSFLISAAKAAEAQVFITSDVKYHEFFDADGQLLVADIGHYESERFTVDLLHDILHEKFPNFAVLKTTVDTNPVQYF